jgi:type IV secretion system protein VirB9
MTYRLLLVSSAALALAGCAGKSAPAPQIALDTPAPAPVTPAAPPVPVEVVAIPEPLPLPGQLKPVVRTARPNPAPPAERIALAGAAARVEPARDGFVNAVQVWPYSAGALYQLYTSPGKVTDIALEPGEKLNAVSAGDTTRWVIGDTVSGSPGGQQVHVLVKPTAADLKTNLLIYTDRRTYHLELTAGPSAWMASAAWRYPEDELIALRARSVAAEAAAPVADDVAIERLRFRYEITGDDPPWRPILAFDDGEKVYIQFPAGIAQGEMPPLFVIDADGAAQLVNYRVRAPYYVVDGLFAAAELRLGAGKQQIVRIERSDGRKRRWFGL